MPNWSHSLLPKNSPSKPPLLGIDDASSVIILPQFVATSVDSWSILPFTVSEKSTSPCANGLSLDPNTSQSFSPKNLPRRPPLLGIEDANSVTILPALEAASTALESTLPLTVSENATKPSANAFSFSPNPSNELEPVIKFVNAPSSSAPQIASNATARFLVPSMIEVSTFLITLKKGCNP